MSLRTQPLPPVRAATAGAGSPMRPANGSSIPSWPPAKRGARNGPIPRLSWQRSARSTVWKVS